MRILGIFRGFPGLGRVVSGVGILETLRERYNCEVEIISYLQGKDYLALTGDYKMPEVTSFDYCSIGLLPTNRMGLYIHERIKQIEPNIVLIDGEPLILQSIKISFPNIKVVALLNPSDVDNPANDKFSMNYFNYLYGMSDIAIVHGLRKIGTDTRYKKLISIDTILRPQILSLENTPTKNIYCILGGGTLNVGQEFIDSTVKIAELCKQLGRKLVDYKIHIICSSKNIYERVNEDNITENIYIYDNITDATQYYSDACLIITRSGRNTLSEVSYLNIPTISFISGCHFRRNEQEDNIKNTNNKNIYICTTDIEIEDFNSICLNAIHNKTSESVSKCGNEVAIQQILDLYLKESCNEVNSPI